MGLKLTKAHERVLASVPDDELNVGIDWKAGRTFLALYDAGLVQMRLQTRSDISCGPGYHGSDWMISRTPAGRAALSKEPAR